MRNRKKQNLPFLALQKNPLKILKVQIIQVKTVVITNIQINLSIKEALKKAPILKILHIFLTKTYL